MMINGTGLSIELGFSQFYDFDGMVSASKPTETEERQKRERREIPWLPYFRGKFCDIPRTMCDGSNSFWCQNGTCNEIVQGETYTCLCEEGYAGENCELEGIPCGDSYCFHNAECIQADDPCDCPADWKGSQDCSMPTVKSKDFLVNLFLMCSNIISKSIVLLYNTSSFCVNQSSFCQQ